MTKAAPEARRFVPFGSHWSMGIEVPYSLGVIEGDRFYSCGQCPLDLCARVLAPGDLDAQIRIVARNIRDQFAPHGVPPEGIAKLVAYVAADGAERLSRAEAVLRSSVPDVPLVLVIGVPPFYYPGMEVEIDAYGSPAAVPTVISLGHEARLAVSGDLRHAMVAIGGGDTAAALSGALAQGSVLSGRLFVERGLPSSALLEEAAGRVGSDPGLAVVASLPGGAGIVADLILEVGEATVRIMDLAGVRLTERRIGRQLALHARCLGPQPSLAPATRAIMNAFRERLAANGMAFADVVKQQTYYTGDAGEADLYENMRVRNACYERPGPASTGLAVAGFADPDCRISIELIAAERR